MCPPPQPQINENWSAMRGRRRHPADPQTQMELEADIPATRYTRQRRLLTRQLMMDLLHTRRFVTEFHRLEAEARVERIAATYESNNRQDMLCYAFDQEIARWQREEGLISVQLGQEAREHMQKALYKHEQTLHELADLQHRETWLLYVVTALVVGLLALALSATVFVAAR